MASEQEPQHQDVPTCGSCGAVMRRVFAVDAVPPTIGEHYHCDACGESLYTPDQIDGLAIDPEKRH